MSSYSELKSHHNLLMGFWGTDEEDLTALIWGGKEKIAFKIMMAPFL